MPQTLTEDRPVDVIIDPDLEEEIRRRAYAFYEERGCEDGHDLEDWLRAERELTAAL
jgi:Protein of unknown function (DUF2934)